MIFQFELMGIDGIRSGNWDPKPYTLPQLKQLFEKWQTGLEEKGWNSLFWGNHDFPRVVSRFGNDREPYREKSAKMLAVLLHGMKGTPYIYQGEEIGMTNVSGLRIEDYQDIESVNFAEDRKKKAGRKKKFVPILHGTAGTMRGRQCSGMRKNTPDLQREHRGWRKIRITRRSMWKTAEKIRIPSSISIKN